MRKTALLSILLVIVAIPLRASARCVVNQDVVGDVKAASKERPSAHPEAVDIVSVAMSSNAQSVFVEQQLVDVDAPLNDPDHVLRIKTSWYPLSGNHAVMVMAERRGSTWRFVHSNGADLSVHGGGLIISDEGFTPIAGSVDAMRNVIRMELPREALGSPPNGTTLDELATSSSEFRQFAFGMVLDTVQSDRTPEPWASFTIGGSCS